METSRVIHGVEMKTIGEPLEDLSSYVKEYVEVGEKKLMMPCFFRDWYPSYADFPVLKEDVWVVTYPKSGTTWCQEMVWCIRNDPEAPEAKQLLMRRVPFFEFDSLLNANIPLPEGMTVKTVPDDIVLPGNTWKLLQKLQAPRLIKSHLSKDLLPDQFWKVKPKVIYICRDPRDVCVSYYFHHRKLEGYTGTFQRFVDLFLQDKLTYSPIWTHILDFWKMRDQPNILFLRFEDMKMDLGAVVRQVAAFMGEAVDEAKVAKLVHHCSFGQMSANPAANNEGFLSAETEQAKDVKFMRKGQVGDWKNHLTEAQQTAFKEWTTKHLQGSDFPYYQDY